MFTHSNNSHFQYLAFVVGKCHTADEAHRVLKDQHEAVDAAIKNYEAALLDKEASRMELQHNREHAKHPWEKLRAEAGLKRLAAAEATEKACYEEACRERAFIEQLIEMVGPHRKYAHLPDHEAMQAVQREEWAAELRFRGENFLLSDGRIPADQLGTMRLHPDFEESIYPHILGTVAAIKKGLRPATAPYGQQLVLGAMTNPKLLKE